MPKTTLKMSEYTSSTTEDNQTSCPSTCHESPNPQIFKRSKKPIKSLKQKKSAKKTQVNYFDQLLSESTDLSCDIEPMLQNWRKLDEKFTNLIEAAEELTSLSFYNVKFFAEKLNENFDDSSEMQNEILNDEHVKNTLSFFLGKCPVKGRFGSF